MHRLQLSEPTDEVKPGSISLQYWQLEDPLAGAYLPTSHASQLEAPSELNDPASHVSHPELSREDFFPAAQDLHDDDPDTSVYLPTSHASHDNWPVAPCDDPAGHEEQFAEPSTEVKVPDEHAEHED